MKFFRRAIFREWVLVETSSTFVAVLLSSGSLWVEVHPVLSLFEEHASGDISG